MKRDFTFKASPAFKSTSSLNPINRYANYVRYYVNKYTIERAYYTYYSEYTRSESYISRTEPYINGEVITYKNNGYTTPGYLSEYYAKYSAPGGYTYYVKKYEWHPPVSFYYNYVFNKYSTYAYRNIYAYKTTTGYNTHYDGTYTYYKKHYTSEVVTYIVD